MQYHISQKVTLILRAPFRSLPAINVHNIWISIEVLAFLYLKLILTGKLFPPDCKSFPALENLPGRILCCRCHVIQCNGKIYHTISHHTIPYNITPCCHVDAIQCNGKIYHTIPYHTIPNHTIPYHTIP